MRLAWSRAAACTFWFLTAAYALLSAIPFASEQFLKPGLSPALVAFAAWHPWISMATLSVVCFLLAPWLRSGHRGVQALAGVWALATALFVVLRPLPRLEPSPQTLAFALLSLVPPVWICLMNPGELKPRAAGSIDTPDADVWQDFAACALAALVVTLMHGIAPRNFLLHLVVFSAVFAVICVVRGGARLISTKPAVEAWTARAALACALGVFLYTIVLRPLSMVGASAAIVASAFGAAFAVALGPRGTGAPSGLEAALGGAVPAWATRSVVTAIVWLAILAAAIATVEHNAAKEDWNFTLGKTAAVASWLLVLAASLRIVRSRATRASFIPFGLCFAVLGLDAAASRTGQAPVLATWRGPDTSIRLITDALAPPVAVSDEGLADLLQRNTNIPRGTRVEPVAIELAPLSGAPAAVRPHIFLFVIDSLRRDYLSPYNRDVTFTPRVAAFARDSTVFERAFTRYGATGLSVPALWVGGLVLHKQYVTPFAPMNTLAKLVEHEQYRQWIGMDNILDVILPASSRREPLDAGIQVADYRFCDTLTEIRGRLDSLKSGPPAFVYSLPQDVHVSVITREGARPIDKTPYGAFYAPYASRVRRLDSCFGEFVDDLKARGLFDDSIVILTADHGDSLGEQGRMGHAYTLFPEIVQVPLIVHLPAAMRDRLRADTSAPAFTTDITPTLYALLGHEPRLPAPFFGRPLFHDASAPAVPGIRQSEMIASSYGSVYAALLEDARRLYIFDAIAFREYTYKLDNSGPGSAVAITDDDRMRGQKAIRDTVESIAKFYGYR